ncbi:NrdR family transcriptional regulator [Thermaerobacillus caldiproteolyticus]|uniref:NrdR family transcriptional regulator n=1 Tax=Thermaerobacillus caldiproteolyticus TaxID=247480 RepID=UPI0018F228EC|nr:hypothetical protein [Anoxybacillus caldiproteolyticus]
MNCPICGGRTRVLGVHHEGLRTNRRRECVECLTRFTTREGIDITSLDPHLRKMFWKRVMV